MLNERQTVNTQGATKKSASRELKSEVELMKTLNHLNIVPLFSPIFTRFTRFYTWILAHIRANDVTDYK